MKEEYLKLFQENKLDVSFFEYVLLVLINEQENSTLEMIREADPVKFSRMIITLEETGYVKWHGDKVDEMSFRSKAEELFGKLKKQHKSDVHNWIDDWRAIFPEGVNNSGFRYRGNRQDVLQKMIRFVSSYKYSKEEIFEATKRYVERFSIRGYSYMQQAHYFIEKKGVGSTLATECESLKEAKTTETNQFNYGGKVV